MEIPEEKTFLESGKWKFLRKNHFLVPENGNSSGITIDMNIKAYESHSSSARPNRSYNLAIRIRRG